MSREPSLRPPFDRINHHALAAASRGTVSTQALTSIPIKEFYDIVDEAVGLRKPYSEAAGAGIVAYVRPRWSVAR
jgi:hypothetical protein